MNIKIQPTKLHNTVEISASKSVAHRMMICGALSDKHTRINAILKGTDIEATARCLNALGADIEIFDNYAIVKPISEVTTEKCSLYCKDSGSTFRFMLPVTAVLGATVEFSGTDRLASRPVSELMNVLSENGVKFSCDKLPFEVNGKLKAGKYEIDASVSSQYITGLLLALPLADGDSEIVLKGRVVSSDYIKITLNVMKIFGVEVETTDNGFIVKGSRKYTAPSSSNCEGDWSSACFYAIAGCIGGGISLENISTNSLQGDKIVIDFIRNAGGNAVHYVNNDGKDCFKFDKGELKSNIYHIDNTPDIAPILAVMCAFCDGESEINGISRLKDKESDRLTETIKMLDAFGIQSRVCDNSLFVTGGEVTGGIYHVPDDHRMAMASIILATYAKGESEIYDIDCISKSYPHFLDDYKKLGGKYDVCGI